MAGKKARFLKVQVGNQQRAFARPEHRAATSQQQLLASEQKGNHAAALAHVNSLWQGQWP
jgi:hypothetical protein